VITSFGAAASGLCKEFQPTAITLDISLPDINGYWVLERIKNDMATRHIPIYVSPPTMTPSAASVSARRRVITKPLATGEALEEAVATIRRHAEEATRES